MIGWEVGRRWDADVPNCQGIWQLLMSGNGSWDSRGTKKIVVGKSSLETRSPGSGNTWLG